MPLSTDEITLAISGPVGVAKSHLAETLQDVLLNLGYQVASDPDHGFVTPLGLRCKPGSSDKPLPPIRIVEVNQ